LSGLEVSQSEAAKLGQLGLAAFQVGQLGLGLGLAACQESL